MDRRAARAVAKELLLIQDGSVEDAKALLDNTLTNDERSMIEEEIDGQAAILATEREYPEFPTYFDSQGREHGEF